MDFKVAGFLSKIGVRYRTDRSVQSNVLALAFTVATAPAVYAQNYPEVRIAARTFSSPLPPSSSSEEVVNQTGQQNNSTSPSPRARRFAPTNTAPVLTPVNGLHPMPLERMREREQESLTRIEFMQKERLLRVKQRAEGELLSARSNFEKASVVKEAQPGSYFSALVDLARCYMNLKDYAKGDPLLKEAITSYTAGGATSVPAYIIDYLWQELPELAHNDFETYFPKMVSAATVQSGSETDRTALERRIGTALDRTGRSNLSLSDKRRCVMSVIELSAGVANISPRPWFTRYAILCESDGNISEATKYIDRVMTLPLDRSNPNGSFDDLVKIRQFYLSHSMPEKADAVVEKLQENVMAAAKTSNYNTGYVLGRYLSIEPKPDVEVIVTNLLGIGGDAVMATIDPYIQKCVDQKVAAGELPKAEALLQARVKASSTCKSDPSLNDWKIQLSDVTAALDKDGDSNRLFDEVRRVVALQDGDVNGLLFNRARLMRKLGKLDAAKTLESQLPKDMYSSSVSTPFGLFAKHALVLGNNTTINFYDSASDADVPSAQSGSGTVASLNDLTCEGPVHMIGTALFKKGDVSKANATDVNFKQIDEAAFEKMMRLPQKHSSERAVKHASTASPNFQASLMPPPGASKIDQTKYVQLSGGDYITSDLRYIHIDVSKNVVTRVFLVDGPQTSNSQQVTFLSAKNFRPGNFQIWYNGDRPLRVGRTACFIYAPHATVEVTHGSDFSGAIVADRIVLAGGNRVNIDTSLTNRVFTSAD